jgi:carboxymethylenebutenolidase
MGRKIILGLLVMTVTALPAAAAEKVTFKGSDQNSIVGKLTIPKSMGPFPTLVMLRGALDQESYYDGWAERLQQWGYLTLQLDGFGSHPPPSDSNLPSARAQCLCDAKSYLAGLPSVDPGRIGIVVWSQRGAGAVAVYCARPPHHKSTPRFRAGVAFYPYCYKPLGELDFPLLVLIGGRDERTPAHLCMERAVSRTSRDEFLVKVYPDASHYFDVEGKDRDDLGYPIKYNPGATADTLVQVRNFLLKNLK